MRLRTLVVILVLLAVAGGAFWRLRPSEPRRIRRQFDRLSERVSKPEGESSTVMALKMNALSDLFDSHLDVDLADFPGNGTYASSEVASHVARLRPTFRSLGLSFYDVSIEVTGTAQARARFTARLVATVGTGESQDDTRALLATLRKGTDGTWRFARFEETSVLQR